MKTLNGLAFAALTLGMGAALAAVDDKRMLALKPAALAVSSALTTEGVVRKIDKAQGKLTVRHGPIPNLEMPAMTMVFRVADVKMLDALKEGDKVKFAADKVNGTITVTAIEALK